MLWKKHIRAVINVTTCLCLPGRYELGGDKCTGLVDDLLEPPAATVAHGLVRSTTAFTTLAAPSTIRGSDMLVRKTYNPLALVAVPALSLVKGHPSALGGCSASGLWSRGRTLWTDDWRRFDRSLDPVDCAVMNTVPGEDGEDVAAVLGGGALALGCVVVEVLVVGAAFGRPVCGAPVGAKRAWFSLGGLFFVEVFFE